MKRFFTSMQIENGNYIGIVHNADTNQQLYKTQPYPSQSQAIKDINSFLSTAKPPTTTPTPSKISHTPQVITNTVTHVPGAPRQGGRCCGR